MADRKSMSKSLRFEVFKRDGFICQYCGAHPPQVVFEVDHIVPVADDGDNDMDNLVTACFDCNRGKAARSLNQVPQSLAEKAEEVAEREAQLLGYNAILQARRDRVEDDVWRVFEEWTGETATTRDKYSSVKMFVERLGLHEVLEAVDIARGGYRRGQAEWKYFCGICWTKIKRGSDG
jgi:hypothetical protein